MVWRSNLVDHDSGIWRSISGAAWEQLAIGRATQAGFFVFFKVWRDQPYDIVIDYSGILFRVEVRGSTTGTIAMSRGARSGTQIRRGVSRSRVLSREDCEFVIGVHQEEEDSPPDHYVIPTQVVEIGQAALDGGERDPDRRAYSPSVRFLSPFCEAWHLLMPDRCPDPVDAEFLRGHLSRYADRERLNGIEDALEIPRRVPRSINYVGADSPVEGFLAPKIMRIWRTLAEWSPDKES